MANYYSIGPEFASLIQGGMQYSVGVTTGYLIDQTFSSWSKRYESPFAHLALMVLQASANGLALRFILPYLHGTAVNAIRDPTGGYLLAMGLIHGQPVFATKSQAFVGTLIEQVEQKFSRTPDDAEDI